MQLIVLRDEKVAARTYTVSAGLIATAAAGLVALIIALGALVSSFALRGLGEDVSFVELVFGDAQRRLASGQAQTRESLEAMSLKLGQVQAELLKLDSLGERLSNMAGVKQPAPVSPAPEAQEKGARGGPFVPLDMSGQAAELQSRLDALSEKIESRADQFERIEGELLTARAREQYIPTAVPVPDGTVTSRFGSRRDPFTRRWARHEGLDFQADAGTTILAAATGTVVTAERHSHYGNMVEIDHGNELTTRYAHASRLLVKEGEVVERGQPIALVGSTGRSTGPHLHFEVRLDGVAQNPMRFLRESLQVAQR